MADASALRFLAFYLPQFHPTAENDAWWGPGFTEWTNVVQGRPLFRGHYQPHQPRDLGYYDLRLPETRAAQAELAAKNGIGGFCYYHYWFAGRRLLDLPFRAVLQTGQPDFPFCVCWANENWTRLWSGKATDILAEQTYSPDDDVRHIRWLAEAFADPRYIRVGDRPLLLVYRPLSLPDPMRTAETWRTESQRLGLPEPYLCGVESVPGDGRTPSDLGFDAAVQFAPAFAKMDPSRRSPFPNSPFRRNRVLDYDVLAQRMLADPDPGHDPAYLRFPCVTPGFDNSVRRRDGGATILTDSTPEKYERWLAKAVARFEPPSPLENLFFVNAWNEWAEGNHLEPDQRWGTAYLDAHARVVQR